MEVKFTVKCLGTHVETTQEVDYNTSTKRGLGLATQRAVKDFHFSYQQLVSRLCPSLFQMLVQVTKRGD